MAERKKGKWKLVLAIVGGVLVLLIISGVVFFRVSMTKFNSYMETFTLDEVDMQSVADGEYKAKTSIIPIIVELSVWVNDHEITDITIHKHMNGQGGDAVDIVDAVIREQSLLVDTISGATYSSKVILKTIEKALNSAD